MTEKEKEVFLLHDIIEAHESGLIQWTEQKPYDFWRANYKGIKLALFKYREGSYPFVSSSLRFFNDDDRLSDISFSSFRFPEVTTRILGTLITLPQKGEKETELDVYLDKIGTFQKLARSEKIDQIINNDSKKEPNNTFGKDFINKKILDISIIGIGVFLAAMYLYYGLKSIPLTVLAIFYPTIATIWYIRRKSY